ncbi:hypothetical protein PVT71_19235 [Salipiger sp. H15]|uniref:Uncharacterized protein n=1 Tax=Alloyangia sp. H15 TaxID=3029062 RepID=A0AAU8AM64_9RHOB
MLRGLVIWVFLLLPLFLILTERAHSGPPLQQVTRLASLPV